MFTQGHVTIMVSNMDASWRFYTETLGLATGDRWGDDYAVVKAPGMEIGLHPGGTRQPAGSRAGYTLSLGTANLDATVDALRQRGVAFVGDIDEDGPQRSINCHDPDGHPLHLREDWAKA